MEIRYKYYKNKVECDKSEATHQLIYHETNKVLQVDTGELFEDVYDPYPSRHTYEVSDELLPIKILTPAEQLDKLGVDPEYYEKD